MEKIKTIWFFAFLKDIIGIAILNIIGYAFALIFIIAPLWFASVFKTQKT